MKVKQLRTKNNSFFQVIATLVSDSSSKYYDLSLVDWEKLNRAYRWFHSANKTISPGLYDSLLEYVISTSDGQPVTDSQGNLLMTTLDDFNNEIANLLLAYYGSKWLQRCKRFETTYSVTLSEEETKSTEHPKETETISITHPTKTTNTIHGEVITRSGDDVNTVNSTVKTGMNTTQTITNPISTDSYNGFGSNSFTDVSKTDGGTETTINEAGADDNYTETESTQTLTNGRTDTHGGTDSVSESYSGTDQKASTIEYEGDDTIKNKYAFKNTPELIAQYKEDFEEAMFDIIIKDTDRLLTIPYYDFENE